MSKKHIPDAVRAAAAGMLAPFGVDLEKILAAEPKNEQAEVRYLSVAGIEEKYGLKRWTLYRLIKAGKITAAKTSAARAGKVLVETASVERFLRASRLNRRTLA